MLARELHAFCFFVLLEANRGVFVARTANWANTRLAVTLKLFPNFWPDGWLAIVRRWCGLDGAWNARYTACTKSACIPASSLARVDPFTIHTCFMYLLRMCASMLASRPATAYKGGLTFGVLCSVKPAALSVVQAAGKLFLCAVAQ